MKSLFPSMSFNYPIIDVAESMKSLADAFKYNIEINDIAHSVDIFNEAIKPHAQIIDIINRDQLYTKVAQLDLPVVDMSKMFKGYADAFKYNWPIIDMPASIKLVSDAEQFNWPIIDIAKSLESIVDISSINYSVLSSSIKKFVDSVNPLIKSYEDEISFNIISQLDADNFDKINENLSRNVANVKKDKLSYEFYINTLITVLLLFLSQKLAEVDKQEIIRKIEKTEKILIEEFREEKNNPLNYTYYVVVRKTYIYNSYSKKNLRIIKALYPNQKVRLIKRKGKWIYIEYFNYLKNYHEKGWCKKKYLNIIKSI